MSLPSLSIITVAKNSEYILDDCYSRIIKQDYPKDKIELILVDGGSSDNTKEVASKYGAKVIDGGYPNNQEARRCVGFWHANNEILAYIDSDNLLPDKNWLKQMVLPLVEDNEIIATQTLRYGYDRSETVLNRYYALFGGADPVVFYLKKMDRVWWASKDEEIPGELLEKRNDYYKVKFSFNKTFPTLGCNGFLVKKDVFAKIIGEPEEFFHTDVIYDLSKMGLDVFGILKNEIIHRTATNFRLSLIKRYSYMKVHHQTLQTKRRYKVYDSSSLIDNLRLLKFSVYSLTFIKPLYDATKGFFRKPDIAWFMHPIMCFSFFSLYAFATIEGFLSPKLARRNK